MFEKLLASFIGHLKPNRAQERATSTLALPPPAREGGLPLLEALSRRRSSREFLPTPLPLPQLSSLLWAAFGINRAETGMRTAPSALNAQEIDVYAATAEGLYIYTPKEHALRLIRAVDARKITGHQDFVDQAPLDLIYVADHAHKHALSAEVRARYAAVSVGAIAENVYLYCASAGLATVARALFDRRALSDALGLSEHEEVVLAQTVGYPK